MLANLMVIPTVLSLKGAIQQDSNTFSGVVTAMYQQRVGELNVRGFDQEAVVPKKNTCDVHHGLYATTAVQRPLRRVHLGSAVINVV